MMFMHILDFFMDFSFANIWSKWKKRKEKKKEEPQGSLETVRHCVVLANRKWGSMGYEISQII